MPVRKSLPGGSVIAKTGPGRTRSWLRSRGATHSNDTSGVCSRLQGTFPYNNPEDWQAPIPSLRGSCRAQKGCDYPKSQPASGRACSLALRGKDLVHRPHESPSSTEGVMQSPLSKCPAKIDKQTCPSDCADVQGRQDRVWEVKQN